MADYFTNFSLIVPLPDGAAQKYALHLAQTMSNAGQGEELPDDIPESLRAEVECWLFETEAVMRISKTSSNEPGEVEKERQLLKSKASIRAAPSRSNSYSEWSGCWLNS